MATQEQKTSMQEQKNALKESMQNQKNAIKESLKEQQAAMEKSYKENKEAAKEKAAGFLAFMQRQVDRVVSPETREQAYERTQTFAKERPLLFTFLVAQALASVIPLGLFAAFTSSVMVLSLGAAVMFSLFWLGMAMLVLVPTLFVTVTIGSIMFFWLIAGKFAWNSLPAGVRNFFTGRQSENGEDNSYAATVARAKKAIKDSAYRNGNGTNGTYANGNRNGTYDHE